MLPRCLASLLVLAVVFAVAYGVPTIEPLDKEFDELNELTNSFDLSSKEEDDEVSERVNPALVAILKFLKYLLKTASANCIKKIFANCISEPEKFITCAKEYIKNNKLMCGAPGGNF